MNTELAAAHEPVSTLKILVVVWAVLICLTGLTTIVSYFDLGWANIVIALLIAVSKASLVVWIFMGVRHVTTLTKLFVVAGLVWLFIMILLTVSDYNTRGWTYEALPWSHTKSAGANH